MDGLKRGTEVGGIVVIAADNLFVVMACVLVRVRIIIVAVFVVDIVVAVIDIIVRANSARIIGIGGRETDAAVMLLRTMGTLIKLRRRKCCRAHMRLRPLILGILVGRNRNIVLLRSITVMRIRNIGRRGSKAEVAGCLHSITAGHVNFIVVRTLIRRRVKSVLSSSVEVVL